MTKLAFFVSLVVSIISFNSFAQCPKAEYPKNGSAETTTTEVKVPLVWRACINNSCFNDEDGMLSKCVDTTYSCYDKGVPTRCKSVEFVIFEQASIVVKPGGNTMCKLEYVGTSPSNNYPYGYSGYRLTMTSNGNSDRSCVVETGIHKVPEFVPFRVHVK